MKPFAAHLRQAIYTLDASIFARDLNPRDADHVLCRELLERLATRGIPIIAPLLLLVEVAGTLSRELRDPMRGRIAVTQGALEIAADRALRGADAVYVAVSRTIRGIPVLSKSVPNHGLTTVGIIRYTSTRNDLPVYLDDLHIDQSDLSTVLRAVSHFSKTV